MLCILTALDLCNFQQNCIVLQWVLSHARYCINVFGNCSDKNHRQLQKIINCCARVVTGRRKYDHISDVLNGPDWFTSKQLSNYHSLALAHRTLRCGEPSSLASLFSKNSSLRSRQTRHDDRFYLPRIRSEAGRRQFAYRAPQLYNKVPTRLTALGNDSFKRNLKLFMKEGVAF